MTPVLEMKLSSQWRRRTRMRLTRPNQPLTSKGSGAIRFRPMFPRNSPVMGWRDSLPLFYLRKGSLPSKHPGALTAESIFSPVKARWGWIALG